MTLKSNDHKVAEIIKGLEARIADLEEKDRNVGTPNILISEREQAHASDGVDHIEERALTGLGWNDVDIISNLAGYGQTPYGKIYARLEYGAESGSYRGYGEGGFGEDGYGESSFIADVDEGYDYSVGGYSEGGYGGVSGSMWTKPARSGWGTGTWGTY